MSGRFEGKTITLGVCGGIAAYRTLDVARLLTLDGARVPVIMTRSASNFVTSLAFKTLTEMPVAIDQFDPALAHPMHHLATSWESDLLVIAPATANTIAKLANGIADDLLTTTALAAKSPILVVPAMNERMYVHPATQRNLGALTERGIRLLGPAQGRLASGHTGWGRMVSPEEIIEAVAAEVVRSDDLAGKKVVITAGPTNEPLDAVRYLGNRSSGKMGYALAEEALRRSAQVVLVSGPVSLLAPPGARLIAVETAEEMRAAVLAEADEADAVVMAAAVADLRPVNPAVGKQKKDQIETVLELEKTPDIIAEAAARKTAGQVFIGFAAETHHLEEEAVRKCREKNVDLIVANDVSRSDIGFASDFNEVLLVYKDGRQERLDRASKRHLAVDLWDRFSSLL